jgi:putative DNA methylase
MVRPHASKAGERTTHARFEEMLTQAFREIHRVLKPDGIAVIVFAHKTTEAWETVINALLEAGLYMTASWPIHTEMQARLRAQESAALASSIYMVCRKRTTSEVGEYPTVRREIEARVRQKLTQFWEEGIRGADFFMSAIGPAVEAFGKYARVEKLSGSRSPSQSCWSTCAGRERVRAGADPEADSPGERRCPHSVLCPLAVDI